MNFRDRFSHPHIVLEDVHFDYGLLPVLHQVNLTVNPGCRIGIVGDNGRGKTTLLRLIAGELVPSGGQIRRHGSIGFAAQTIESSLTVGQLTGRAIADSLEALRQLEHAALSLADAQAGAAEAYDAALARTENLAAWDAERRLQVALTALGADFPADTLLSALSVGQRHRVWLACLLGGDHDFIVLDEPTNHLDAQALEFLTEALQRRRGGIVLVTHDRALLADVANTIVDLDPTPDRRPRSYGDYSAYRKGRVAMRSRWEQDYAAQENQRELLADQLVVAQDRLIDGWRPPKGTGKHQRATRAASLVNNVHRRERELAEHALDVPPPPLRLGFPGLGAAEPASAAPLLEAEQIHHAGRLSMPVTLGLSAGARLIVTGANGAGKSTLLSMLAGRLNPTAGRMRWRVAEAGLDPARVGYLGQEPELPGRVTVAEHFADSQPQCGLPDLGLLPPRCFDQPIAELSVGQQRRLELATVLARLPNVLLLDEPTNHLSGTLIQELTEALRNTQAAVVLVSHDRQLLRDLADWPILELA